MQAVLLGTGSPPPNPMRCGPSTLPSLGAERYLVDAGSGVGVQLVQAGVRPYDWPRVLSPHHHSDRVIDLGHLLITRWIVGQNAPLEIWSPAGTRRQMDRTVSAFLVEHDPVKPAFGYRLDGGGRSVVVSGDTRPCDNLMRGSRDVDCLIHECREMARTSWYAGCGWPSLPPLLPRPRRGRGQGEGAGGEGAGYSSRSAASTAFTHASSGAGVGA